MNTQPQHSSSADTPHHNRVLAGQRALISGASQGIGEGIAIQLARAGADVAINFHQQEAQAEQVARQCREHGVHAVCIQADMGQQAEVERLVQSAHQHLGGLDILVSNAAYSDRRLMLETDLNEFRRTIDVSMWGAFYLVRSGAQVMVNEGTGGNIVVIGSPHAHIPVPGAMAYNMAKSANDWMAKTAAAELACHGIRVNIVHPGWTDTPGERKFFDEATIQKSAKELPLGRLARIDEIGRGVVFLCDPASAYITGSTLTIDGGIQLPGKPKWLRDEDQSDVDHRE